MKYYILKIKFLLLIVISLNFQAQK